MSKLAISMLYFLVAFQITSYLCWAFNLFGGLIEYPLGGVDTLNSIFSLNVYTVIIGAGGAIGIGLAALLLRQGVYAIYAMLLWGIGVIFSVFQTFILAIPNTLAALIPEATNPLPGQTNPLIVVVVFLFTFGVWWFIFGMVIQRDAT